MAGYEERGVRARVAAHCAQLAGYRRSLYDTESMRYGTYTMWNLYDAEPIRCGTAMQLCSVLLKTAMRRYAEHAALWL